MSAEFADSHDAPHEMSNTIIEHRVAGHDAFHPSREVSIP